MPRSACRPPPACTWRMRVVQHLADSADADLLHLKGPAVLEGLRDPQRTSFDVDVLVRPSHLSPLIPALESHGWDRRTDFATGSPFAHAANWWHDDWGWLDVHVAWPGARSTRRRSSTCSPPGATQAIAHVECHVPDRTGQRLVLLLHAARSPGSPDKDWAWAAHPSRSGRPSAPWPRGSTRRSPRGRAGRAPPAPNRSRPPAVAALLRGWRPDRGVASAPVRGSRRPGAGPAGRRPGARQPGSPAPRAGT